MSDESSKRRASYGPSSPLIGVRGASTRKRITAVSLDLFGRFGYFDTSVDAIAKAADISRATLYQYFRGKDDIFLELLEECRAALYRVARRIGPLGPDSTGFDNLHWWLGEWSWVFEKYSTMFVQWSAVGSMDNAMREQITRSIRDYNHRIADRLRASANGLDPEAAAMVTTGLVHDVNLLVHTGRAYDRSPQDVIDTLSVFLQFMVFPETPATVLSEHQLHVAPDITCDIGTVPVPAKPDVAKLSLQAKTEALSSRSAATVDAIARAGAAQFNAVGYRRTSVEDIVERAGVARGTFYKYFSDKVDLCGALSVEWCDAQERLADAARRMNPLAEDGTVVNWLSASFDVYEKHFGLIEAWSAGLTDSETIAALGDFGQAQLDAAISGTFADATKPYPFDPVISALIVRALSTSVLKKADEILEPTTRDALVDLAACCIRRGFFTLSR